VTRRVTFGMCCLVVGAALASIVLLRGTGSTDSTPGVDPPTLSPTVTPRREARVIGGFIHRDERTLAAIRDTASVTLPAESGAALSMKVKKSRYCLELWHGAKLLKVYQVALGGSPQGPKQRQGDGRTPEGRYLLIPHHPSPSFGPCFYICYPNHDDVRKGLAAGMIDVATARRLEASLDRGRRPDHQTALGGLILLHGTRNRSLPGLTLRNWTLGCIAMENPDIEELLAVFKASDRPFIEVFR
jgi:hypothetical protein